MDASHAAAIEFVGLQRELRERLLEDRVLESTERQLAAEMLLYLDDPRRCWQVCTAWLVRHTRADRVDGGFGRQGDRLYSPMAESQRSGMRLPSVVGASFDCSDASIRTVWEAREAVLFADAASDARIGPRMRTMLSGAGTRSKLAVALRSRQADVGLLCADSQQAHAWSAEECHRLDRLAKTVIAPILHAAWQLQSAAPAPQALPPAALLADAALTPAELRVAQLVVAGLSYKEIARQLDKSRSTVDHQLRSMRAKIGVHSMPMLVRELARRMPEGTGAASSATP
ncbi:LuxR C-terminal-related transcriptional regulator [Paucibacter sp. R3-3]|uniref:LuxR C-terminal-related transcriptional regulator n=1 Tax=Roseateles agri TaxID=3098619 RepID=A0ABU5DG33_9BURK|nr:LuxR C-terminal-related transcriptional regulator [Paucibacter sp. R3-3]MDY0745237.1 LuxR C-terminal-related transcriptional regulator [Paucibacter sp. R3-3]